MSRANLASWTQGSRPAQYALGSALLGFLALYLPIYWWALDTIWQSEEHGHGTIVLAVVAWLFYRQRDSVVGAVGAGCRAGWPLLGAGLLLYVSGRALDLSIFVFTAQLPILAGILLLLGGRPLLRLAWFPLLYTIFMIPLPGFMIDAATANLKQYVSIIAEEVLYATGYPIARNGVMLTVGQYQLLVADACSGLNSMFSLSALGVLYMYIAQRKSVTHNIFMLLMIPPIAFTANIIRVMILVLITYHLGDEAGQGFLHGLAGMVLMLVALAIFIAMDGLLVLAARQFNRQHSTKSKI